MKRVNIKYLIAPLILILSLTLGTSCSFSCAFPRIDTSPPPSPPATHATAPIDPNWTLPPTESSAPVLPDIASVVAKVKPSVVAINTEVITYDFLGRPFKQQGAGSGWIIDEALNCRESGEAKTILIAHSGHGHFDLAAYDEYLSGKLVDYEYPEEKVKEALAQLPKVPTT